MPSVIGLPVDPAKTNFNKMKERKMLIAQLDKEQDLDDDLYDEEDEDVSSPYLYLLGGGERKK